MIPIDIKYYDDRKMVLENEMRKIPKVRAQDRMFAFEYNCTTWNHHSLNTI
jgi:predicted phosphatase